jgi:hypothetical protein
MSVAHWQGVQSALARELGVKELSPSSWGYWSPQNTWISGRYNVKQMCENWMLAKFDGSEPSDSFVKERLSFVELFFRWQGTIVAASNHGLPSETAKAKRQAESRPTRRSISIPGDPAAAVKAANAKLNSQLDGAIHELNERFRQADCQLNYHNGFIQIAADQLTNTQIEGPFWAIATDAKWKNVDHDMKEAIDLRDSGGRDPAFYAAKSLESAIKIISDEKSLTTGKEKGAHNYIDNLRRGNVIDDWEVEFLKAFFTKLRNPFSHGAGSAKMPGLSKEQTDWALEHCMSWVKGLIRRF